MNLTREDAEIADSMNLTREDAEIADSTSSPRFVSRLRHKSSVLSSLIPWHRRAKSTVTGRAVGAGVKQRGRRHSSTAPIPRSVRSRPGV
jgi:hypothetical protein